jgi:hypothetical protein
MIEPIPNEKYVAVPYAAKKYYFTARTLIRWVKRGKIDGVRHAHKWYVGIKSLEQYLKSPLHLG